MSLCKGLVLSLQEVLRFVPKELYFSLHFIDVGCSSASLDWLREKGVELHSFSRQEYLGVEIMAQVPQYADAQLCRPFLPHIIPDKNSYIWIDCDIWLQGSDALPSMAWAIADHPDKIAICPEHHYGYIGFRNQRYAVATHREWYKALYRDESLADQLCFEPVFNTGLFIMRSDCQLWDVWAKELRLLYSTSYSLDHSLLHYAEQLGLNKLAWERKAFLPLDPIFNYACGGSMVMRHPKGKVVVGYPAWAPVKGVHLLFFSRYGAMYMDKGLLYQKGEYLSDEEKNRLMSLVKL